MPRQCAAVGCHEKNGLGTPFSFHSFPRDKALRKAWTLKVNRMDVKTKRLWQPKDCDVLCSKHFEPSCFPDKLRLANTFGFKFKADLVPGAIPTIFNHNEASRKRKQEILDQQSASVKRRHKKRVMSELLASLEGKELKDMRSLASTNCQDAQGLHDRSGVETSLPQVIYLVPLLVFNTAQQNMNGKISNFKRELETEEPIYEAQQQKECAKITIIKREALSDKREEFHEHHQTLNAGVKKREVQNQEEQITKFEQQIDYVKNIKKELKIEQEEQLLNTFKYADFVSTINMKMECPIDND